MILLDMGGLLPRDEWGNVLAVIARARRCLWHTHLYLRRAKNRKSKVESCPPPVAVVDYPKQKVLKRIQLDTILGKITQNIWGGLIPPGGHFDPLFPIPNHIVVYKLNKAFNRDLPPRLTIEHLVFQCAKKAFAGCIIWGASLLGYGSRQLCLCHAGNPAWPPIVAPPICMYNGMFSCL